MPRLQPQSLEPLTQWLSLALSFTASVALIVEGWNSFSNLTTPLMPAQLSAQPSLGKMVSTGLRCLSG